MTLSGHRAVLAIGSSIVSGARDRLTSRWEELARAHRAWVGTRALWLALLSGCRHRALRGHAARTRVVAFPLWTFTILRLGLNHLTERPRRRDEQGKQRPEREHLRHALTRHMNPPVCGQ